MGKPEITIALSLIAISLGKPAIANDCQKFAVTAVDGYVNVRSTPQVKPGNILGTLPSGESITIVNRSNGWLQINLPTSGWVAGNQIGKISCNYSQDLLFSVGLPTIKRLGDRSIQGDLNSAEILVKMSRGVDGIVAEVYAEAISKWANDNPSFLISVLEQQSQTIRKAVLFSLDFGFGIGEAPERQKFELFLEKLSSNNLVLQDWSATTKVYKN